MRFLFVIFALLFTLNAEATAIVANCKLKVAEYCFSASEVTNLVIGYAYVNSANNFSSFRRQNGSAGFAAGGASGWRIKVLMCSTFAGSVISGAYLGYGDAAVTSAGALTNGVMLSGSSNFFLSPYYTASSVAPNQVATYIDFLVPNGKYGAFQAAQNGMSCIAYGIEE